MPKIRRISFDEYYAGHIYEMILEHLCVDFRGNCGTCEYIDKRFRKFLGTKETNYIIRLLKRNGYCNRLNPKLEKKIKVLSR